MTARTVDAGRIAAACTAARGGRRRHSADLAIRDDAGRRLLVLECWNRFGDLGAAARSSSRKLVEVAGLAAAIGGERPYNVGLCWLIRLTAENRVLLRR